MEVDEPKKEELLPIDIHYNKLLDWLIDRRHCKSDWQASILEVREKINLAIQDIPAVEEITNLIKGSHINYFHCLRIVELLKDTESGTKNIFGRYSSGRMKDWMEILSLYEKNDLYLAEAAQLLARSVNYEVPLLKKQKAKCQQVQKESSKKEADCTRTASEYKDKYAMMCKQMCIEGRMIRTELSQLIKDLPNIYSKIAAECKTLQPSVDYYTAFINFNTQGLNKSADILPSLRHVLRSGNTTIYEFERGRRPERIDEITVDIDLKDELPVSSESNQIDWGELDNAIDFGCEIEYDLGDITIEDGGIEIESSTEKVQIPETEIKAVNKIVEDDVSVSTESHEIIDDGVARGRLAMTLLDNIDTRNRFLDDLLELEAFLIQRQVEMQLADDIVSNCQFQTAPEAVLVDSGHIADMVTAVQSLLNQLTSIRMQHLMLIRNSPRYVDRLEEKLKQTLAVSDKMLFYRKQSEERRVAALEEEYNIVPQLEVTVKQIKTLQLQIAEEISKRYKNRHVNIMGEINAV